MQIKQIDELIGICELGGVEREVNLFLLSGQPLQPGDFVLVHVGYAIQKVSQAAARAAWQLLGQSIDKSADEAADEVVAGGVDDA